MPAEGAGEALSIRPPRWPRTCGGSSPASRSWPGRSRSGAGLALVPAQSAGGRVAGRRGRDLPDGIRAGLMELLACGRRAEERGETASGPPTSPATTLSASKGRNAGSATDRTSPRRPPPCSCKTAPPSAAPSRRRRRSTATGSGSTSTASSTRPVTCGLCQAGELMGSCSARRGGRSR